MLVINDKTYIAENFEKYDQYLESLKLSRTKGLAIAACLEDTATWLELCFFLKINNISVMPIHPSTPLETAQRLASRAGCQWLYYQNMDTAIEIEGHSLPDSIQSAGLIQMSSGTTGEPKIITRSWQSIDTEIKQYVHTFNKAENMTPVIACPVSHSYGLICGVMVALQRGQIPIIVTNINPKYLIKTLLRYERPLLYSSPTMLQGLIRLWPEDPPLHAVMTSGTMMSKATFTALSSRITHIFQQYGCSEAGCISVNQQMQNIQDMGVPLDHLRISCSQDRSNPTEIIVRTKTRTEQVIHTQDLGYLQENTVGEQRLHFVARQDDTIITAGLNVYPQEVEDILLTHPDIDDALIFKIKDPHAGERVALHYVSSKELDTRSIRDWCRQHLASYQIPQVLKQIGAIKRMPNGKVNRKYIADTYLDHAHSNEKPEELFIA